METMMILYKSLIASYLNYGLLLWCTESDKVLTLQKKAIRLISNSSYISHTNPLFIQHKLLKIGDLFKLKLLKLYYKLSYNLLPSYFDKYREIIEHETARVLRINYIHPPLIRRVYAECSPLLQLIKLINDLRNDESDTILQQIEMRNNSYRTFSYNVSRLYLNTYDPVYVGSAHCVNRRVYSSRRISKFLSDTTQALTDKYAPPQNKTITLRPHAPWYTEALRREKRERRKCERTATRTLLTVDREIAEERYARRTVQIEQAKAAYYTSQIDKNKGDSKTLFKLTNSLMGEKWRDYFADSFV